MIEYSTVKYRNCGSGTPDYINILFNNFEKYVELSSAEADNSCLEPCNSRTAHPKFHAENFQAE